MKESAFARSVMKKLKSIPEVLFATRVESGDVAPGIPDVYLMVTDPKYTNSPTTNRSRIHHIWLELKTGSKVRKTQEVWHNQYYKAGGLVGVLTPDEDLYQTLVNIVRGVRNEPTKRTNRSVQKSNRAKGRDSKSGRGAERPAETIKTSGAGSDPSTDVELGDPARQL